MSRLERFRAEIEGGEADGAVISNEINQRYLTGFDFSDGLVVVTKERAYLVTDFRYAEAAKAQAREGFEVIVPEGGQLLCVAGLLSDNGCKRVLFEEKALTVAGLSRYEKAFCDFELTGGASAMLEALRACKDEDELAAIGRAQAITDAAFSHILRVMTPEMTETDVALEIEFFMRRSGAEGIAFETIAVSGSASSLPHGVPRRRKLEKGFLTMDFGARVDGYCSDMTRTVVLGKADAEMKRLYETVLSAQRAALEAAHEGASCRGLDKIARDIIHGAGYKGCFGHSLGHGVGMLVHENPRLSTGAEEKSLLERGHVITFEPGIYIEGRYGCRIEDMACIRPDGSFYDFTKSTKELIELF